MVAPCSLLYRWRIPAQDMLLNVLMTNGQEKPLVTSQGQRFTPLAAAARDGRRHRPCVVSLFLAFAYREVQVGLRQAAGVRAQGAANQLGSLLTQSSEQRLAELRLAARHAAVADHLRHPSEATERTATAHLSQMTSPNPQTIELWTGDGNKRLSLAIPPAASVLLPAGRAPLAPGIGPLQVYRETVFTETVIPFSRSRPSTGRSAATDRSRLMVVRRRSWCPPTRHTLARLVGNGATVKIGGTTGGVWTDSVTAVDPPPVALTRGGVSGYQSADGQRHLGHWPRWRHPMASGSTFPESVVLARPGRFCAAWSSSPPASC